MACLRSMPTLGLQVNFLNALLWLQGTVSNMLEESVVQPLLVTTSALNLATECVRMILKVSHLTPGQNNMLYQLDRSHVEAIGWRCC